MEKLLIFIGLLITFTWMYAPLAGQDEPEEDADKALVIEQLCDGFPGTKQKKATKQQVILKDNNIYMKNFESPHLCIIRGDKKVIWEIDTGAKIYNARTFAYLDELKKDKEAIRKTAVRQINAIPDRKAREEIAKKAGYPVDKKGYVSKKPVSETKITGEEKEINGYKCYRVKIYEDLRVALDLWLTKKLKAPESLMGFYEKLGCFADETVAEMKKIKNFPILLQANLDFGSFERPVKCEIVKLQKKKVPADQFELPKELPEKPEKIIDVGGPSPPPPGTKCPVCGKEIDPKSEGIVRHRVPPYEVLFDSRKCHLKFVKELGFNKGDLDKTMQHFAKERAKNQKK